MNKHQYQHAFHFAEQLHYKLKDFIDNAGNHHGRELLELSHRLTQDVKSQKNPRSLENNAKQIEQLLLRLRSSGDQVMDFRHIDMLVSEYRKLIQDFRKFENY